MRIRELLKYIKLSHLFKYKMLNILSYILHKNLTSKKVYFKPLLMDIEPTTGCNFKCTMCQVSSPNFKAKNMKFDTFKNIIDQNKQLLKIKLQGLGEPLINKHFFEMAKYVENFGIFIETISNGSLLTEDNIKKIIKSKSIYKISVSIDGATNKTFENIRINSNFDKVKRNVKLLNSEILKNKSKIQTRALCLLQKSNYDEREEIIKLCRDLGFSELEFQVQMTGWGIPEWEEKNLSSDINYNNGDTKKELKKLINKYRKDSFSIRIQEENLLSKENKCSYPWSTPYISAEGKVVPCCLIADPAVSSLGDINENKFSEIWNSKDYKNIRQSILDHNLKEFCKNCYKEFRN